MIQQRTRNDFVQVRLTEAGLAFAGKGAQLRIATLHMHYVFTGQASQEVLAAGEWRILAAECDAAGKPLFEQVSAIPDAMNAFRQTQKEAQ